MEYVEIAIEVLAPHTQCQPPPRDTLDLSESYCFHSSLSPLPLILPYHRSVTHPTPPPPPPITLLSLPLSLSLSLQYHKPAHRALLCRVLRPRGGTGAESSSGAYGCLGKVLPRTGREGSAQCSCSCPYEHVRKDCNVQQQRVTEQLLSPWQC